MNKTTVVKFWWGNLKSTWHTQSIWLIGLISVKTYVIPKVLNSSFPYILKRRMYSSRMRTVRCSSRLLGGGVSAQGDVCPGGVCSGGCLPRGVDPSACWDTHPLWTKFLAHSCFLKHYLSATSFADGKEYMTHLFIPAHKAQRVLTQWTISSSIFRKFPNVLNK